HVDPQLHQGVGMATLQMLGIGVGADELHTLDAGLDHVVDGIRTATADADDLDHRVFTLVFNYFEKFIHCYHLAFASRPTHLKKMSRNCPGTSSSCVPRSGRIRYSPPGLTPRRLHSSARTEAVPRRWRGSGFPPHPTGRPRFVDNLDGREHERLHRPTRSRLASWKSHRSTPRRRHTYPRIPRAAVPSGSA